MKQPSYSQAGFTLIELLVSTAIFSMVALLGYATISQSSQLEEYTTIQRDLAESATLGIEAITREVRLATGIPAANLAPFSVVNDGGVGVIADPFSLPSRGTELKLASIHPVSGDEIVQIIRRISDESGRGQLFLEMCLNTSCSFRADPLLLTPESVDVVSLAFETLGITQIDRQPFLKIEAVFETEDQRGQFIQETVRTVVTSRQYE